MSQVDYEEKNILARHSEPFFSSGRRNKDFNIGAPHVISGKHEPKKTQPFAVLVFSTSQVDFTQEAFSA